MHGSRDSCEISVCFDLDMGLQVAYDLCVDYFHFFVSSLQVDAVFVYAMFKLNTVSVLSSLLVDTFDLTFGICVAAIV